MIDTSTGEILIESVPLRIGSEFTRQNFLSSPLGEHSSVIVKNEPRCSFRIEAVKISGLWFNAALWFCRERLEAVHLSYRARDLGASWSEWSEEKELKRKRIHDSWLVTIAANPAHSYKWGEISSDFDRKSGGSSIVIRYFPCKF